MELEKQDVMISVNNLTVKRNDHYILSNINFKLSANEHLAIVGNASSGKTTLGKALGNKIFFEGVIKFFTGSHPNIVFIEQQHGLKNKVNTTDLYYQQRFNSLDAEDTLTVSEYIDENAIAIGIIHDLELDYVLARPLIQLSNGENKKVQLAKGLSGNPDILILDNPFLGLDVNTRMFLHRYLNKQTEAGKLCILITSPNEIPAYINKILELESGHIKFFGTKDNYFVFQDKYVPDKVSSYSYIPTQRFLTYDDFTYAVEMKNVMVKYGEVTLLEGINWTIRRGDRWHLKGDNGAGKSTLLSLITGDNPQAYANEISLFDKRRGTGETIWEIKQKIGFLSPEVHLFYDKTTTLFNTIGSGFFDSMGLFQKLNENQKLLIQEWIRFLGFENIKEKCLYELSLGQQRMILVARAFIKNPPLLILDEPCQGLDQKQKQEILRLIDIVCHDHKKTLIYVSHYDDEKPNCLTKTITLRDGKMEMVE